MCPHRHLQPTPFPLPLVARSWLGGRAGSVELAFQRLPGVTETAVGYCGGSTESPTYPAVSRGDTKHAEAVRVLYDPAVVQIDDLLELL